MKGRVTIECEDIRDAWALRAVLAEAGIEAKVTENVRIRNHRTRPSNEWRSAKVLLAEMADGKVWRLADVSALLELHEFAANSASALLHELIKEGVVVRVDQGLYQLKEAANGIQTDARREAGTRTQLQLAGHGVAEDRRDSMHSVA